MRKIINMDKKEFRREVLISLFVVAAFMYFLWTFLGWEVSVTLGITAIWFLSDHFIDVYRRREDKK